MNSPKKIHDSAKPAHGQQVITACAFIHHNFDGTEKVFLPKRAATKQFLPNVYELPGGHLDYGEDIIIGLKREIKEEFEKDITVGDPFAAFTYLNEIKGSHSIEVVYFAQFDSGTDGIVLHPEDHSGYGWFAESELPKAFDASKMMDDPEALAVKKGFALLKGERTLS
ncbi:MAG TPA: NUDIX hydrolase [Patescibacteria group bacterium]|nr:NUDIX hydrolase [Patescibacteria group bacterium]